MQGPRRKWRPRIVLLTVIFGVAAAAHIAALPLAALLGLAAMLWVAEGHRSQALARGAGRLGWGAGAGLCLLRLFARRLQLCLPLRGRIPVGSRSIRPGDFSSLATAASRLQACRRCALSGHAQIALLRQHRSAALRLVLMVLVMTGVSGKLRGCGRCRFCSHLWAECSPMPTKVREAAGNGAAGAIVCAGVALRAEFAGAEFRTA
jgi:hypothetical protein